MLGPALSSLGQAKHFEVCMTLDDFIVLVEAEFEEVEKGTLKADTVFVEMKEWCSLYALILMGLMSVEFDLELTGDDLIGIKTVSDLYAFADKRQGISRV
jgi:acyl carrier protein